MEKIVIKRVGDWEEIMKIPPVHRANSHDCYIETMRDEILILRHFFIRGTIVTFTVKPSAYNSTMKSFEWKNPSDLIRIEEFNGFKLEY